jgi:hypothetical protein
MGESNAEVLKENEVEIEVDQDIEIKNVEVKEEVKETTKQVSEVTPPEKRNPTGKGGFGDNPQNRSDGRWSKENSFSYWMNYFKSLTVRQFFLYESTKPEDERTVAESLAYARVSKSRNDLKEFQEVANRTEGMPVRRHEFQDTDGDPITQVEVVIIKSREELKNETETKGN